MARHVTRNRRPGTRALAKLVTTYGWLFATFAQTLPVEGKDFLLKAR